MFTSEYYGVARIGADGPLQRQQGPFEISDPWWDVPDNTKAAVLDRIRSHATR